MVCRALVVLIAAVLLAGCGDSGPTPIDSVQNYLSDLGEGNYSGACAQLDHQARDSLLRLQRRHANCTRVFVHCLPDDVLSLKKDQSQLLFATVQINKTGNTADALVSGTAVARAVKEVGLAERNGTWKLTSYGRGLTGCPGQGRHRRS
jgi:hypothetical protein